MSVKETCVNPLHVAVVACVTFPELGASDTLYADALRGLGAHVRVVQWNGSGTPVVALSGMDVAVLRCPWDYPQDVPGFLRWLDEIERAGVRLLNQPALVRWNLDKRYLFDLAQAGIAVPPTAEVRADLDAAGWCEAFAAVGAADGRRAVLKPCWGGSGLAVRPTTLSTAADDLAEAEREAPGRTWLLQAFLPGIAAQGETSFVFVAGRLAHAVCTRPAHGEFRVNSRYAPRPSERVEPDPQLVDDAARVLAAIPGEASPLYARIDGAADTDGRLVCLEAEVIDPTLFLDLAPETAGLLARATLDTIQS